MIYTEYGDSFLVQQFREFYTEVIRLKQVAREAPQAVAAGGLEFEVNEDSKVTEIWGGLMGMLDKQQRIAIQLGGEYMLAFEELRYVMVALADEIFLHADWPGRYAWNFNLLESKLYQTHVAGELFFQRAELLMASRNAVRIEQAKVYLMALSLGFQGKYRGEDGSSLLQYRRRLHNYIFQGSQHLLDTSRPLFPETYEHTLKDAEVTMLPPVRKWIIRLSVVVALAWLVQHIIWRYLTYDVREIVQLILKSFEKS
jgi:type VI secretion system protein ImpK